MQASKTVEFKNCKVRILEDGARKVTFEKDGYEVDVLVIQMMMQQVLEQMMLVAEDGDGFYFAMRMSD